MDALSEYSEEWKYLVEHFFVPKCQVTGYCTEKKSCGRAKVFDRGADNLNKQNDRETE